MNKHSLKGLLKTLIVLISQNNDLLEKLIREYNNSPFLTSSESNPDIFLNTKEVCMMLKCSSVTLWKLRRDKKIRFLKFDKNIRFRQSDVVQFITQNS
ncbi:helix-turn-helix domain-containing protein [Psychroserpens sp. Hel_I_66]|uniref:helix-turn-helix domain-containing protein n=1 Tax=Psychroserpens sp. Hel_I_66 TaxID=1250004 RepID=UPI0009DD3934